MQNNNVELTKFIDSLHGNKKNLTLQQYRTIKGQAMSGNIDGAKKGMGRVIKRGQK
jgi:hypothetical protein